GAPTKAGDKITYNFKIKNTGNVTLTSVNLDDALVGYSGVTCGGATTLALGVETTCSTDYTVLQSDVNAGNVHNSATANGTPPTGSPISDTKTTDTSIVPSISIELTKTATPTFSSPWPKVSATDKFKYDFKIKNTG